MTRIRKLLHVQPSCRGVAAADLIRNSFIILCKYAFFATGLHVRGCTVKARCCSRCAARPLEKKERKEMEKEETESHSVSPL